MVVWFVLPLREWEGRDWSCRRGREVERGGWKEEERLGRWGVVELVLAAIADGMGGYLFPPCEFAVVVVDKNPRATRHGERGREGGE